MTVTFVCRTHFERTPPTAVCAASLDIDTHLDSMADSAERAVDGKTSGTIGLGETVTWRARHFGIWWTMTSRITELQAPQRFVDEQSKGPFKEFRHEHLFRQNGAGTDMVDTISLSAPLGPLGWIAERVALRPYLRRLISSRNAYLVDTLEVP